MRLGWFAAAVAAWPLAADEAAVAAVASMAMLVLFGLAVRKHRRLRGARELGDQALIAISEAERRSGGRLCVIRASGRPNDPAHDAARVPPAWPTGPAWTISEQEQDDLDLYAPLGVFGLLNRTSTAPGARRLRDMLESPRLDPERIRAVQATVVWLRDHLAPRLRITGGLALLRGHENLVDDFTAAASTSQPLPPSLVSPLLGWWGIIGGVAWVLLLAKAIAGETTMIWALVGLTLVNGSIYARMRGMLNERLAAWRRLGHTTDRCAAAAGQAATDLPDHGDLGLLRRRARDVAAPAALPRLARLLYWADTGGPMHMFLNMVAFYDLHVAVRVLGLVTSRRAVLLDGVSAMAELDALVGLACFGDEQPVTCLPEFVEADGLQIEGGRHPLIGPAEAIANDVRLTAETHLWVVTGSNMAGKSTFLRMVGINTLLAHMGSAAVAHRMTLCPLRLITDLRVRDSLAKHESYFLAEVRHLRRLLAATSEPPPILGLIDEPFRGTNSLEQSAASVALVRHLVASRGLFLLATHDHLVPPLADGLKAVNRHFEERLGEDGAVFDYRLKPGPATSRNALAILEREGYPKDLVADARAQAAGVGAAQAGP